jgi:hypothetical protein
MLRVAPEGAAHGRAGVSSFASAWTGLRRRGAVTGRSAAAVAAPDVVAGEGGGGGEQRVLQLLRRHGEVQAEGAAQRRAGLRAAGG